MSDKTGIEWTDATWNPVTGCTEVSPGCDHCYAKTFAERWRGTPGHYFENGFDVQLRPDKLDQPLRWKKPRRIFVNSMSDLFHDSVPNEYIARVFAVMACSYEWSRPTHTFQVLTKRHARMRSLLNNGMFRGAVAAFAASMTDDAHADTVHDAIFYEDSHWPLRNVWLGVSAENQQWADIRIPALLDTPAAVRFVSAEPLLGPIDLVQSINKEPLAAYHFRPGGIDWVIVGGESGPRARPMHPDWARSLRDQCHVAGVPFMFKQWGEYRVVGYFREDTGRPNLEAREVAPWPANEHGFIAIMQRAGKAKSGRMLGGRTWDEYPEAVSA